MNIRFPLAIAALIVASVLGIFVPTPAQAIDLPVEGGPGGGGFRIKCDGFITGFEGHTGAYIDHLRVRCASFDSGARRFLNRGPLQITIGTSGRGGPASASCPDGWAVFDINFQNTQTDSGDDRFVHHINFKCAPPTGPETIWRTYGPTTPVEAACPSCFGPLGGKLIVPTFGGACPPGEFAVGLHGRSGLFVDALGLICEPLPAGAPPPPPQAAAPAPIPPQQLTHGPATCKSGFVWRLARPEDLVCVTPVSRARVAAENRTNSARANPAGPSGPASCKSGYVWREAFDGDTACVTPQTRALVRQENQQAASNRVVAIEPKVLRPLGKRRLTAEEQAAAAAGAQDSQTQPSLPQQNGSQASLNTAEFTGTWVTTNDKGGVFELTLVQSSREVIGSYVSQNGDRGRIRGNVGAGILQFNFEQDSGFRGNGQFNLAADGNSFTGGYRLAPHPKVPEAMRQGTWNARRK